MQNPDNAPLEATAIAKIEGVCAGYRPETDVLVSVYFEARPSTIAVITGPSGAGKSTLMHVMRMALTPRSGRYWLFGDDAGALPTRLRMSLKRRIGYVAQSPVLMDDRTALDNVCLPLAFGGEYGASVNDVLDLLGYVGLAAEADRPAGELSVGQRRLVAIARALVVRPEIVLADEPTAGLAPEIATRVLRLMMEVRNMGAAVVMTTQDPHAGAAIGASQWRLANGRLARSLEALA